MQRSRVDASREKEKTSQCAKKRAKPENRCTLIDTHTQTCIMTQMRDNPHLPISQKYLAGHLNGQLKQNGRSACEIHAKSKGIKFRCFTISRFERGEIASRPQIHSINTRKKNPTHTTKVTGDNRECESKWNISKKKSESYERCVVLFIQIFSVFVS